MPTTAWVTMSVATLLLYLIVKSPFGLALQGIRESEVRMQALGYNTFRHKYVAFIISGLFAGLAGVMYVHFNGIVTPTDVGMTASGTTMLMVIIGGSGTLWGGAIGSAIILFTAFFASIYIPQRWPLILGAIFVLVVILFRQGIYPYLEQLWKKSMSRMLR
ncbi:branched-chain amino acid ABC transporter permease [Chloroflexota bacterium]